MSTSINCSLQGIIIQFVGFYQDGILKKKKTSIQDNVMKSGFGEKLIPAIQI